MLFPRRMAPALALAPLAALPAAAAPASPDEARRAQMERNKDIVVRFYNAALNDKNVEEALSFVGAEYRQHNPSVEDGREGLRNFLDWVRQDHPDSRSDIKQVFADGDYVLLNVHMIRFPGERGLAIGEIFRLEEGRIVEHWDRIQPVPENARNANTMF